MRQRIEIVQGDITQQEVDAIVNAADRSLQENGGINEAIHRAAGPGLREECRELNGCGTGEAEITKGYELPAKHVIHTVGPVWDGGNNGESEALARCYRNSFSLAGRYNLKTIAFPAISTGTYNFPLKKAARIALEEAKKFLERNNEMEKVVFVCFGEEMYKCYKDVLEKVFE